MDALIADTITFMDGIRVIRAYQYNRRGQRTFAGDKVLVVGTGSVAGDRGGALQYFFNSATARLDSLTGKSGTNNVGKIRWIYDLGGRDSIRVARLGSGTGYAADSLLTKFTYDVAGRVSKITTSRATTTWYQFDATGGSPYNLDDDLLGAASTEPPAGAGGPILTHNLGYGYASDGTRRLASSIKAQGGNTEDTYSWNYDVFGNRTTEQPWSAFTPPCEGMSQSNWSFGGDNQLTLRDIPACTKKSLYWNDHAGNRLVQTDSDSHFYIGPQAVFSYTAKNEMIFSMTWTVQSGTYDWNWHWYDGNGLRVVSQVNSGGHFIPSAPSGPKTYYVYDGGELALVIVGPGTWWVRQRFLSGGVDAPLAGRFDSGSGTQNLALVTDRKGTTMAALRTDWTQEAQAVYYSKSPFGELCPASCRKGLG